MIEFFKELKIKIHRNLKMPGFPVSVPMYANTKDKTNE